MTESAFRFLLQSGTRLFRPSRCFIVADPKIDDRRQWTLELDPPKNASWIYQLDDLKDWMLHGGKAIRQIVYNRKDPRTPFRDLEREEIFREYMRKILDLLPIEYRSRRKHVLMPSISDETTRIRYKQAIEAAIPGVSVLPEPEMVAEYFRLLARTLNLEAGANNVLLVVDVGASTANMTLVVSRRDNKILDVRTKGAQRNVRVRALRGDSVGNAGRWIDLQLAKAFGISESAFEEDPEKQTILRTIEQAKIRSSREGIAVRVSTASLRSEAIITPRILEALSGQLCHSLLPCFDGLCDRLYTNQTSSVDAMRKSEDRLRERGVSSSREAHRLIDIVLLAGGTSLLPGFQEAMASTFFPSGRRPTILRVGGSFATAAAAGGLAHILHNYNPARIRPKTGENDQTFEASLQSTLPYPLVLGIKQRAEEETQIPVLDPDDPFIDDGGRRPIEGVPALSVGSRPRMRLIPGGEAGVAARRGRKFQAMHVVESPGRMDIVWDPTKQHARIQSNQVQNTGILFIDASALRTRQEFALDPVQEDELPDGALAVDAADDIILDMGMSKLVALTAERGWVSAEQLESILPDDGDDDNAEPPAPPGPVKPSPPKSIFRRDWTERVSDSEFAYALDSLRKDLRENKIEFHFEDVVVALLALAVRPVVLLAGPPGCGKSTLVRAIAQFLGKDAGKTYHEIAVQAHWENDAALFSDNGLLSPLFVDDKLSHLILFDEFNLTRPEYYLSRLFNALDGGNSAFGAKSVLAPCRVFGTMNVDEFSRPPSPKIIDRCFLIELEQVSRTMGVSTGLDALSSIKPLPGLPEIPTDDVAVDDRINTVLNELHTVIHEHGLRQDLLPSRRVLADIRAIMALHHRLDLQGKALLERNDLVDRVIASRILIKLAGSFDQLQHVLHALEKTTSGMEELPRTRRRLKIANQQSRFGFISPWQ